MPEFTLQAADRVQVLRGPGVFVRVRGEPAEGRLAQVREPDHFGGRQVRGAFNAYYARPRRPGGPGSRKYQLCLSQLVPMRKTGVRWPGVSLPTSALSSGGR